MSDSLSIILGVVLELTRAWNPDSAPHMITMHTKGHTVPGTTGPSPPINGVVAGIFNTGQAATIPTASTTITPIFMYELR